eukprot:CAMPEP_0174733314 /NCGR_PEP_ID=MMETSP1094-20130205/61062_1 /TAXON_ID=156173 /ORGANISM="Chrysochromulina brevifilum, Strain UTEX LB 985" /LENGTH=682 /DNA_ID=CAMNT_0015935955 /DNA_START=67 /DNA_END=2112 /DNA_ORIENTATION=+
MVVSASGSGSDSVGASFVCDRYVAAAQPGVHVHEHNVQLPVFGLAVVLIGGGLIEHFFSRMPIPHTVLLLIFGCILGLWVRSDPDFSLQPGMKAGEHSWGSNVLQCNVTTTIANDLNNHGFHFGNSLRMLGDMDPHLLLHVILPPLLFESAFAVDWHIFAKLVKYALILAVPGLIFCTTLSGVLYVAFYGWPWEAALLLGGILSATDPVAVVALLREMGVKKSLATLIEAESLLNDGTAVVVYSILLKAVKAGGIGAWLDAESTVGAWHILWVTVRMSILGPMFGASFGFLCVRWLESNANVDRNARVEVICTFAMPFLVFYLAETAMGSTGQMSGVLAVVAYGLVFASPYGRVRIDPEIAHFLHGENGFWGVVGHLVNTLIFVISGITIILNVKLTGVAYEDHRRSFGADLGYGIATYVLTTVLRGCVMFGLMPYFRRGPYGYDWRDALVITWGGLRGAVGLALAVSVFKDASIDEGGLFATAADGSHFRQVVLVHCSIEVLLTLLINAPSSGVILKRIGLTKLSGDRVSQLQMSQRLLRKLAHSSLAHMGQHPVMSDMRWEAVQRFANFDAMCADILGQHYVFDPANTWMPPEDESARGEHRWSCWGEQDNACRNIRRSQTDSVLCASRASKVMGATDGSPQCVLHTNSGVGSEGSGGAVACSDKGELASGQARRTKGSG